MNNIKNAIIRGLLGIPLGIAVGMTIGLIIALASGSETMDTNVVLSSYIAAAVIGLVYAAASVIWDIERWSLFQQIAIHFVITTIFQISCALGAGWITFSLYPILVYLGICVVIYTVIGAVILIVQKRRVDEVNKVLEE